MSILGYIMHFSYKVTLKDGKYVFRGHHISCIDAEAKYNQLSLISLLTLRTILMTILNTLWFSTYWHWFSWCSILVKLMTILLILVIILDIQVTRKTIILAINPLGQNYHTHDYPGNHIDHSEHHNDHHEDNLKHSYNHAYHSAVFQCDKICKIRHAKSREPGNLVPGHFWSKIQTFFRNQSSKEIIWNCVVVL